MDLTRFCQNREKEILMLDWFAAGPGAGRRETDSNVPYVMRLIILCNGTLVPAVPGHIQKNRSNRDES